jgi:hypothetical protein
MQAARRQAEADLLEGSASFHVELGDLESHNFEMREMLEVAQVRALHGFIQKHVDISCSLSVLMLMCGPHTAVLSGQ